MPQKIGELVSRKIGELVVEEQWMNLHELEKILLLQDQLRRRGEEPEQTRLGQLLVREGLVSPSTLDELLRKQRETTAVNLHSLQSQGRYFFFGPYYMRQLIGKGGAGAVFLATCKKTGRSLAIKILNIEDISGKFRARFLREIKILKKFLFNQFLYYFPVFHSV